MSLKVGRRSEIAPFYAMEVLRAANRRAQAGERVLHLEVGEPAAGAPGPVLEAARLALADNRLGYTEALGIPPLRAAIAAYTSDRYGLDVAPEKNRGHHRRFGRFHAGLSRGLRCWRPRGAGRAVLSGLSQYPVGAGPSRWVALAAGPEHRFQPAIELLEQAGPLDGLILASPSNPTGTMLRGKRDRRAGAVVRCRRRALDIRRDLPWHHLRH